MTGVDIGWGSIFRRRVQVWAAALIIYVNYKVVQITEKWTLEDGDLWEKAHQRNAKRLMNLILDLGGLWVKVGHYLSTRVDVLPQPYIFLLNQLLQYSHPPRPLQEVCQTIEKEFAKTMDDLFADFVEEPLATSSIAQFHRANLINGQRVVAKVQHKGVKAIILEDLKNVKSVIDWIAWAEPKFDFNPMIDEWCKEALEALDFNKEAENTRTVSRNIGCKNLVDENKSSNSINVLIPKVIQSTKSVIILEYMNGISLNDSTSLEAFGIDKQKLIEEITRAYAHQIYVDGFFNSDPQLGNFLVSKEAPHCPILLNFGFTKKLSSSKKQALAKILLASTEGNLLALLSAISEMGLKLRQDMAEQAMEVAPVLFRSSTPTNEAYQTMKYLAEPRDRNMKVKHAVKCFNPVNAFPGDVVIFARILNFLRGLSFTMNVDNISYLDLMRPFAESVILGNINKRPAEDAQWIYNTPVHSDIEAKLRDLLVELGKDDKIIGIQVCAYKDGKVIIDTAAGVLGRYDPRPVQPDSLFTLFSASKGIVAGMVHWLIDNGKLKLEENVSNIWSQFRGNGKEHIKVHHVLNHTAGLHNALDDKFSDNPFLLSDYDECLKLMEASVPEVEPGKQCGYHYLSFGWLCGGIIEHASGKKFQEILEEVIIHPLKIEGELYIGVPPGVESRLASLSLVEEDRIKKEELLTTFKINNLVEFPTLVHAFYNMLNIRRGIIPGINAQCSARALARYYAALADGGVVPPPHSSFSNPPLGSHPHISTFSNRDGRPQNENKMIFSNPRIHDAFMGVGEYGNLCLPDEIFGLGLKRFKSTEGSLAYIGQTGLGGSTGLCDIKNRFAIAVTVNKMTWGDVTEKVIELVCSELNIPMPENFL